MPLTDAAIFTILDYFNAKVGGDFINKIAITECAKIPTSKKEFLNNKDGEEQKNENSIIPDDYEPPIQKKLKANPASNEEEKSPCGDANNDGDDDAIEEEKEKSSDSESNGSDNSSHCCDYHNSYNFDPWKCRDVMWSYNFAKKEFLEHLSSKSIVIMGKEVKFNRENIQIDNKHIIIGSNIPRVNFAACWNGDTSSGDYLTFEMIPATLATIPPIPYVTKYNCHHLKIDMFCNNYMRLEKRRLKRPEITTDVYNKTEDEEIEMDSGSGDNDKNEMEDEEM